ncbi:hypothetical protein [Mucilaginibacter sp. UYCu711]|uniref:hypothetical protein n=1 Tax=Mucilaginibacter sp. UYCu711 TaxID=3156339 RepID=UPI003D1F59A1
MGDKKLKIFIFGKNFINKEEKFERVLNKIQAKYSKWFNESAPRELNQKHSTLKSHLSNFFRGSKRRLEFRPDSNIPKTIKKECLDAYDVMWP